MDTILAMAQEHESAAVHCHATQVGDWLAYSQLPWAMEKGEFVLAELGQRRGMGRRQVESVLGQGKTGGRHSRVGQMGSRRWGQDLALVWHTPIPGSTDLPHWILVVLPQISNSPWPWLSHTLLKLSVGYSTVLQASLFQHVLRLGCQFLLGLDLCCTCNSVSLAVPLILRGAA